MNKFYCVLYLFTGLFLHGQKQNNVWCFGKGSGIDFNSGTPVLFGGAKTGTDISPAYNQEGTSSVCDSSGNLLFYTGGETIWNRLHQVMPGGSGIMGGGSSTQAALIVPKPGSNNLFYVFTTDEFQSYPNSKGYRYTIVDMYKDNCKGAVLEEQKNILLMDSCTEKLSACRDAAGTGYWILGHKMYSNQFRAWHLTSAGITATVNTNIGTIHAWNPYTLSWTIPGTAMGQMKLSPQGTRIAVGFGNYTPCRVDLFDFNPSTGSVSNHCYITIDSVEQKSGYGVEFSPDGTKLYTTHTGGAGPVSKRIYQFDLSAGNGNCASIRSSSYTVWSPNSNSLLFGLQLAPDGKIYTTCDATNKLGCIASPDSPGALCNFMQEVLTGTLLSNFYTLPSVVAGYNYSNTVIGNCLEVGFKENSGAEKHNMTLYPNPSTGKISIRLNGYPEAEVIIQTMFGQKVVHTKYYEDTGKEIVIDNLPEGYYLVLVKIEHNIAEIKKLAVIR